MTITDRFSGRRIQIALLAAAVLAAAGAGLALRSGTIETVHPAVGDGGRIYGLGTVEARVLSRLGFEATGTLIELNADHGDLVSANRVLARLDDREQQAKLTQAEATLAQAQARLDRARINLTQRRSVSERRQELARRNTVSVEAAEDARAAADMAAADVEVAKADHAAALGQLQRDRALLSKLSLTTPYDSLVIERTRELGTVLSPGTSVFTVIDPKTVWIKAYVDEAQAGALAIGQPAEIRLRSLPGRVFFGRVDRIDIESDRISEERRVHVAFDAIPPEFHLGEQTEVLVDVGRIEGSAAVPGTALVESRGAAHVWVAQDNRLARRTVRLLRRLANGTAEVEGLDKNELIVVRPSGDLAEGRRVRPVVRENKR
jgi:HlyD family secretion protein